MPKIVRRLLDGLGLKFLALALGIAAVSGVIVIIILWAVARSS